MPIPLEKLLTDFSTQPGASESAIEAAETAIGFTLPKDYRDFLLRFNGGEGFIGRHYLVLSRVEELHDFNRDVQVAEYAPGLSFFGSDGGGDAFAFDRRSNPYPVVIVPLIGMSLKDALFVAKSFTGLLEKMAGPNSSLFPSKG